MPVSRIAFALADLRSELGSLAGATDRALPVEIRLDHETFAAVERELVHYIGGASILKREPRPDDGLRGVAKRIRFSGVSIVAILPGNRWEI